MPLIIMFRDPKIEMVIKGELDKKTMKKLAGKFKISIPGEPVEKDSKILIVGEADSNIVYIRDISMEEYEEKKRLLKEMEEKQRGGKKIDTPNMVIKHPFSKKGN